MTPTQVQIAEFMAQRSLAVVGVSRRRQKFGSMAYRALKARGYKVFAVNPRARDIDGEPCYPSLKDLPEAVGGAVIVVPKSQVERVVADAVEAGIPRLWIQQGCATPQALADCAARGVPAIHGQCILMFAEPVGWLHGLHRFILRLAGRLPV